MEGRALVILPIGVIGDQGPCPSGQKKTVHVKFQRLGVVMKKSLTTTGLPKRGFPFGPKPGKRAIWWAKLLCKLGQFLLFGGFAATPKSFGRTEGTTRRPPCGVGEGGVGEDQYQSPRGPKKDTFSVPKQSIFGTPSQRARRAEGPLGGGTARQASASHHPTCPQGTSAAYGSGTRSRPAALRCPRDGGGNGVSVMNPFRRGKRCASVCVGASVSKSVHMGVDVELR